MSPEMLQTICLPKKEKKKQFNQYKCNHIAFVIKINFIFIVFARILLFYVQQCVYARNANWSKVYNKIKF